MKVLLLISIFSLSACSTHSSRSIASIYSETEKKYRCYYDDSFYYKSGYTLKTSKDKIYLNYTEIKPSEGKYKLVALNTEESSELNLIVIEDIKNDEELFCKLI